MNDEKSGEELYRTSSNAKEPVTPTNGKMADKGLELSRSKS